MRASSPPAVSSALLAGDRRTPLWPAPRPEAALQEPNGDILVALTQGMLRYLPNGQLDTSFGTGGLTLITSNQFPTGLGLGAAGGIFALPGQSLLPTQQGVTELSLAGQLDATVTPEPLTATSAGATFDTTNEQFVYPQLVSLNGHATLADVKIQRFTTAGTLASSTGPFTFAGTSGSVKDAPGPVAVLPNGQALLLGSHANGATAADSLSAVWAFARSNPNGTLDSTFGTGGTALTNVSLNGGGFSALFPQSDGTAIAVGLDSGVGLIIARFNL
jgi:Domain of unknown function (DUF5122) beta-propeller